MQALHTAATPNTNKLRGKSKLQPVNPAVGPGDHSGNTGGMKPLADPGRALAGSSEGQEKLSGTGCRGSLPAPRCAKRVPACPTAQLEKAGVMLFWCRMRPYSLL